MTPSFGPQRAAFINLPAAHTFAPPEIAIISNITFYAHRIKPPRPKVINLYKTRISSFCTFPDEIPACRELFATNGCVNIFVSKNKIQW